jgi:acyl carrier protein
MTTESAQGEPDEQRLLAEVVAMLAEVTGESAEWLAQVGLASRLEGDLYLNSLEVAALGGLLRAAHGDRVDLPAYLAGLDIDQIIALTVGDLVAYLASACPAAGTDR